MLSRHIFRRIEKVLVSSRCMATLVANEEFPLAVAVSPKTKASPVVKESTLANGIKIISSDTGASVSFFVRSFLSEKQIMDPY